MHFGRRSFHTSLTTLLAITVVFLLVRSSLFPVTPPQQPMMDTIHNKGSNENHVTLDHVGSDRVKNETRGYTYITDDDIVKARRKAKQRVDDEQVHEKDSELSNSVDKVIEKSEKMKERERVQKEEHQEHGDKNDNDRYPGGSNPKNVWIVSNRRSGTHMTMDVIAQVIQGPLRIFKTNHVGAYRRGGLNCACLYWLQSHGRIVHAYRDIRDVVIAMYYYNRKFNGRWRKLSLQQYLNNTSNFRNQVIEDWVRTTSGWFRRDDVLNLNYDETVTGMPYVYERIAKFLNAKVKNRHLHPKHMTMVSGVVQKGAGKGSGGWKKFMSDEMSEYILKLAKFAMERYENEFLKCDRAFDSFKKKKMIWNMTNSFEIAGNSKLRAPAVCPKAFFGHSSWIVTQRSGDEYKTRKGVRRAGAR